VNQLGEGVSPLAFSRAFTVVQLEGNIPGFGFARIEIHGNEIGRVTRLGPEREESQYLSPGFVDIQINGFAGVDFSAQDLDLDKVASVLPLLRESGVTSFCPTLITASHSQLRHSLQLWKDILRADRHLRLTVPCIHLEGPYLAKGNASGVHNSQYLRPPNWEEFSEFQKETNSSIGIITLAPELPGALDFIRRASEAGVVVALGHTEATTEEIHFAVNAGARLSTHLGNGSPQMIDRHRAPLWSQLACDQLTASIICDSFHLPREVVKVVLRSKGIERCILVTDAVYVAGLPVGTYSLGGVEVELLQNGQVVKHDRTSLAGSSVTLLRALTILMDYAELSLEVALRTVTENPARLLPSKGLCSKLEKGQPANLVVFDKRGDGLQVSTVLLRGEEVYP